MTNWFFWYRRISRGHPAAWRFFFAGLSSAEQAEENLMAMHTKGYEYLLLPDGEFPDKPSRIAAEKFGIDNV